MGGRGDKDGERETCKDKFVFRRRQYQLPFSSLRFLGRKSHHSSPDFSPKHSKLRHPVVASWFTMQDRMCGQSPKVAGQSGVLRNLQAMARQTARRWMILAAPLSKFKHVGVIFKHFVGQAHIFDTTFSGNCSISRGGLRTLAVV